jgi:hypothetical protein
VVVVRFVLFVVVVWTSCVTLVFLTHDTIGDSAQFLVLPFSLLYFQLFLSNFHLQLSSLLFFLGCIIIKIPQLYLELFLIGYLIGHHFLFSFLNKFPFGNLTLKLLYFGLYRLTLGPQLNNLLQLRMILLLKLPTNARHPLILILQLLLPRRLILQPRLIPQQLPLQLHLYPNGLLLNLQQIPLIPTYHLKQLVHLLIQHLGLGLTLIVFFVLGIECV